MKKAMNKVTKFFNDEKDSKSKEINGLYIQFAQIFKANECDEELYEYLKSINIPTNQVCAKTLKYEGAWSCKDCEMDSTCIICNECYENSKEKHKDHRIAFKSKASGCCDCGDPDAWNPNGFCFKHQGTFSSEEEISHLINQTFPQETVVSSIKAVLIELINRLILIISTKKIHSIELNPQLNQFLTFLTHICEANQALLHIVSELLIGNYPYLTTHQCFRFTTSSVEVVKSTEEQHQCCCSFIQILFQIFGNSSKHEKFLFLMLHNYKLKIIMGLSIFASFDILAKNDCESIEHFSVQVISDEVSNLILNSSDLMNYIADRLYDYIINSFTINSHFRKINLFIIHFYCNIGYLIKQKTMKLFKNHLHFYKRLIDILCHVHNSISVTKKESFQREEFNESDINIELYLLELFSLVMTIFDYSNIEQTNILFDYFIDIFTKKNYKQLNMNEYSFHITLTRAFSIFLTQYVFTVAMSSKTDLLSALSDILSQKDFNFECIIQEVFKFFGFLISTKLKYWPYYGETMIFFNYVYYNCDIFYLCDFSLIKLLCSLPKYSHMLSFDKIFLLTDVLGSYDNLKTLLINNIDDIEKINLDWTKEKNSKEILLGQQVINLFISILRVDDYLNELLYISNNDIKKNKIQCDIYSAFELAEKESIITIMKSKMAHIVISNDNYCLYSMIEKRLGTYLKIFITKEETMAMINELLDQNKVSSRKGVGFSLKPQYYPMIDLSFILVNENISAAERYIMEFKKKEINLIQAVNIPIINCARSLQREFESAFYSKSNTEWMLLFLSAQLSNKKWENILRYYLFSSLKLIAIMMSISKHGNQSINNSIQLLQERRQQIIETIDHPSVEIDDIQSGLCLYLKNEIVQFTNFDIKTSITQAISTQDGQKNKMKNKKAELLSKYKKQFKDKAKQFQQNIETLVTPSNDNIGDQNAIVENNQETNCLCVICRTAIDTNSYYQKPFGRFGIIIKDYFIRNIQLQNIKRSFKLDKSLSSETPFSSFLKTDPHFKKKKQMRVLTCNHFVHFACYEEYLTQSLNDNNSFLCPFCKISSNMCIPNVHLNSSDPITKGLSFRGFIEAYKQNNLSNVSFSLDSPSFECQNPIHNFFENFLSVNSNNQILISDLNKQVDILLKSYDCLFDHFRYFFVFYENYTNGQIDLMNTIIASIRLVTKTGYINKGFLLDRFLKLFTEVSSTCSLKINNGIVGHLLMESLFLYMILFDDEEEEDKDNIIYIFRMFLPYIFVEMFVVHLLTLNGNKLTIDHFKNCLTNAEIDNYIISEEAKIGFNYYLNKITISRRIINNAKNPDSNQCQMNFDSQSKYNLYLEELNLSDLINQPLKSLLETKYPSFWPDVIEPCKVINNLLTSIYDNYSEHPIIMTPSLYSINMEFPFNFIDLPPNMIDFASSINSTNCSFCSKSSAYSVLCLTCGKKTCYTTKCLVKESKDSSTEIYSVFYHNQTCGGGNIAYISSDNGEIIFISKKRIIKSKIFAYINQFGEEPRNSKISKEYILSQPEVNKARDMFISYSYRKSASLSIFDIMDFQLDSDDEMNIDM